MPWPPICSAQQGGSSSRTGDAGACFHHQYGDLHAHEPGGFEGGEEKGASTWEAERVGVEAVYHSRILYQSALPMQICFLREKPKRSVSSSAHARFPF